MGLLVSTPPSLLYSKITEPINNESSAKLGFVLKTLPFRHRVQSPKSDRSVSAQSSMREFCYLRQRLASYKASRSPLSTYRAIASTGCFCREQRLNLAYQSNRVSSVQCAFKESMIHQILQFILHFRILPRSSSLREPRGPSLKGVFCLMRFALVTLVSKSRGWFEKEKKKEQKRRRYSKEKRLEPR